MYGCSFAKPTWASWLGSEVGGGLIAPGKPSGSVNMHGDREGGHARAHGRLMINGSQRGSRVMDAAVCLDAERFRHCHAHDGEQGSRGWGVYGTLARQCFDMTQP